jgi:hypothetical protein
LYATGISISTTRVTVTSPIRQLSMSALLVFDPD